MPAIRCLPAAAALVGALIAPLTRSAAQGAWVPPQPPCVLSASHFKVNGGVLHLKTAAEKPTQREQQLAQARIALSEAIVQNGQDKNPAAWYYLGRYYFEVGDAIGADSTFARAVALAPPCASDVGHYRDQLWANVVNAGLGAWQDGKEDSAAVLFRLAARLRPENPKAFSALAGLYSGKSNYDSALVYYRRTAETAGNDTAFAKDKRDALDNITRILLSRAQDDPAAQRCTQLRASIDSINRGLTNDSTVLSRITTSSRARKARGGRLAPADQQTFAKDSTARARAVEQGRAGRAAALDQLAGETAKLQAAYAPAIEALRAYLAEYPAELEAAKSLATLYAQSGRAAEAGAVFDSVAAHSRTLNPDELFTAGQRLVSQGFYQAGARALSLGLQQNPYRRDALYLLGVASYQQRDSTGMLPVAQRLVALDPLNRASLKLLAGAWDLRGRKDSTLAYITRADSLLAVEVTVSAFLRDSAGAAMTVLATNVKPTPSKPFRLTVELLDARGQVVATEARDIPSLAPQQPHQLDLTVHGKEIAGWRYRAS